MPSIARAILLAVQATSFLALAGISPKTTMALASPLSGPSSAAPANSPSSLLAARVVSKYTDTELVARIPILSPTVSAPLQQRASSANHTQLIKKLQASHDKMKGNAATMKSLVARTRTRSFDADNSAFKQECASTLKAYKTNFEDFQSIFILIAGTDKGLACYDPTNDLQTILKGVVNFHKTILSCTVTIIYAIPGLGPILGPIVYDIKCLVDALLDATEVLTDCLLNATGALLRALGLGPVLDLLCDLGTGLLCLGRGQPL
ncbi:hypothetical protein MVEN_01539800 [Mycena venus]|uniref:Uncharacterized protein n=1 Tax=Mycena venus TaxID=2733690 RepID=A0A8H6XTH5_9AGAR|nr:hypothetical protein MVEN_01539800 [Mycena venus]